MPLDLPQIQNLITEALAAMTWPEVLAVLFGLAYVLLAAAESIWCWPAALVSVSIYIYLCLQADLYAETGLQVFYWVMAIIGWRSWARKRKAHILSKDDSKSSQESPLPIRTWSVRTHVLVILLNTVGTFLLSWILSTYTGAANPYLDSFTTVFSLFTTWMVTQKVLENWLYWIVIDTASIFLYASRDLYLTSLLFFLYTLIAAIGYWKWHKEYKAYKTNPEVAW